MSVIYDFTVKDRDGKDVSLSKYKGKVLLVVNTATECGFTPTYADLQKLYSELAGKGLEILDFPCNQFGSGLTGLQKKSTSFAPAASVSRSPSSASSRSMALAKTRFTHGLRAKRAMQASIPSILSRRSSSRSSASRILSGRSPLTSSGTSRSSLLTVRAMS